MSVETIQHEHLQERVRRILEDPLNPILLVELLREHEHGRSRFSSGTVRWLKRLLRRSLARSLIGAARPPVGTKAKKRQGWEKGNKAKRDTPEKFLKYLKVRFEWNIRNGKAKPGRFLLTQDQLEWLLSLEVKDPRKSRGLPREKVKLSDLGRQLMFKREETPGDFSIENLSIHFRKKRRRLKKERGITNKSVKGKLIVSQKKLRFLWKLEQERVQSEHVRLGI